MPQPKYVNEAYKWRRQIGTSFGTDSEGKDFIELKYRGASGHYAVQFQRDWPSGKRCPLDTGFGHCTLKDPPTVRETVPGFAEATLRFEGLSPTSGDPKEGTDPNISHSTEETEFSIYYKHNTGGRGEGFYVYNRVIVQASYVRATKPTANLRFASKLDDSPDPRPIANGELKEPWFKDYSKLVLGTNYKVAKVGRVLNWSQSAPDVYDVTEEHCKYLVGIITDIG